MFHGSDFPQSLDESLFETWLENGRLSKMSYCYLLIVWDAFDLNYVPVYVEHREQIQNYEVYGQAKGRESLVAAYDLYSQSKISLN